MYTELVDLNVRNGHGTGRQQDRHREQQGAHSIPRPTTTVSAVAKGFQCGYCCCPTAEKLNYSLSVGTAALPVPSPLHKVGSCTDVYSQTRQNKVEALPPTKPTPLDPAKLRLRRLRLARRCAALLVHCLARGRALLLELCDHLVVLGGLCLLALPVGLLLRNPTG